MNLLANPIYPSSPKEGQCQRRFKLPYKCNHFTCWQDNAQNPSSKSLEICEQRTSKCTSWVLKRQGSKCQHLLEHRKSKRILENIYCCFTDYTKLTVWITQTVENPQRHGNTRLPYLSPKNLACRARINS